MPITPVPKNLSHTTRNSVKVTTSEVKLELPAKIVNKQLAKQPTKLGLVDTKNMKNKSATKSPLDIVDKIMSASNKTAKIFKPAHPVCSKLAKTVTKAESAPQSSSSIKPSVQQIVFPDKNISASTVAVPHTGFSEASESSSFKSNRKKKNQSKPKSNTEQTKIDTNYGTNQLLVPCQESSTTSTTTSLKWSYSQENEKTQLKNYPSKSATVLRTQLFSSDTHSNLEHPKRQIQYQPSFGPAAAKTHLGICEPGVHTMEEILKMSKSKQKFFLTEDPRKYKCLRNPEVKKPFKGERAVQVMQNLVTEADNFCAAELRNEISSSESEICDIVDLENPLQLDFQGMDYQNTYLKDEQDLLNQRHYRSFLREADRKRIANDVADNVEIELQQERIAIPNIFTVEDRNEYVPSTTTEKSMHYGKLYRRADKPINRQKLAQEWLRRYETCKTLYLARKEKTANIQKKIEKEKAVHKRDIACRITHEKTLNAIAKIETGIEYNLGANVAALKTDKDRRTFPHTIKETQQFKKKLEAQNRIKREEAKIKQEFFTQHLGKQKVYREAKLEISGSPRHSSDKTLSEQSSDDADDVEVGKSDNVFKLRGFLFRLGDDVRGKRHQREQLDASKHRKGCATREEWLAQILPKKEKIKVDIGYGIEKIRSAEDPKFELFPIKTGFTQPKAETSAVRQYVIRRLGRQYEHILRKRLKVIPPRLKYSVKKFNLINYMYRDSDNVKIVNKELESEPGSDDLAQEEALRDAEMEPTRDFLNRGEVKWLADREKVKLKRFELQGIPCKPIMESKVRVVCEPADSTSSSDWVPEPEPDKTSLRRAALTATQRAESYVPLKLRGNMPAPKHREPTLQQHTRHPRDYQGLRVPSQLFGEAVNSTGIPHMLKMEDDIIEYANLKIKKADYTKKFDARHHHDHLQKLENDLVVVHYQPKVIKAEITQQKPKRVTATQIRKFSRAEPPSQAFVNIDHTMPKVDVADMILEHKKTKIPARKSFAEEQVEEKCQTSDFVYHSRPYEIFKHLAYTGRENYLQLLKDVKQALKESNVKNTDEESNILVDREALVQQLNEDLKSIQSCLTSVSSSECTNLTYDSGSNLVVEDKIVVPLDYVRKSVVPFEELHRSRFKYVPINIEAEEANPFKTLPFAGQLKAQKALSKPKDNFFTYSTRLDNTKRKQLEVIVEDVRRKPIGRGRNKYPSMVVTDFNPTYIEVLTPPPPFKVYPFKSGHSTIKNMLRVKFENMMVKQKQLHDQYYEELNMENYNRLMRTIALYEKLFDNWEKIEYKAAMAVVWKVKSDYEITDSLRREFYDLERQTMLLTLDIVFDEGVWIRRLMLQNFHYLLADIEWRREHDWIHRDPDGEEGFEDFDVSIARRGIVNIRNREADDALAIKKYYDEVYLPNKRPILQPFPDAPAFIKGVEDFKVKTFLLLLQLHFTLNICTELQGRLEDFEDWWACYYKEKQKSMLRKTAKKVRLAERTRELEKLSLQFSDISIEASFNDHEFTRHRAVISEVWRRLMPSNIVGGSDVEPAPVDQVSMISSEILEMLEKFESVPAGEIKRIETKLRQKRALQVKISKEAFMKEQRIEYELKKVIRNLEPPFEKPKRVGKLKKGRLVKKEKLEPPKPEEMPEFKKLFINAFLEDGHVGPLSEIRDSALTDEDINKQTVPFYFDHFLEVNGYSPDYNFQTNVELRDGPEENRCALKHLLPDVRRRMEQTENLRHRTMLDNIAKYGHMYVNVKT